MTKHFDNEYRCTISEEPAICEHCGKEFVLWSDLDQHIFDKHEAENE